jgi:hypothetical protein
MDLEALLRHYFGTVDIETLDEGQMIRGREKLALDFGVEQEPSRRFALWTLLDALGDAPLPSEAFEDPAMRRAAENYLDAARRLRGD